MMKWITILCLLANVAFFGWHFNQKIDHVQPDTSEEKPKLASSKKLVLLSEMDALPPLRSESGLPESQQEDSEPSLAEDDLLDQTPEFAQDGSCITIGPYAVGNNDDDRISIKNWLSVREIPVTERIEEVRTRERYWVYLEPKATEAEARAQVEKLKQQGVSDYYMVTKGNMKNAISLGLFSSQEAVNRRMEELAEEGYKPVVIPQHKIEQRVYISAQLKADQADLSLPALPEGIKMENKACSEIALSGTDH